MIASELHATRATWFRGMHTATGPEPSFAVALGGDRFCHRYDLVGLTRQIDRTVLGVHELLDGPEHTEGTDNTAFRIVFVDRIACQC
jgi:hypothetical protein